jgi:4-hydroxy-tetrahydrodipicolinate synthase
MATPETLRLRQVRVITAVKTPYLEDGNIDIEAYDKLVEHQIANGVEGIIVGGTTGEGHLFSWDEHLCLIAHTKAKFDGKIIIVGNTGSNSTSESVWATRKGFALGMDASLLINPYYGKTSAKGIVMHLEAALKFGPAFIYNVPGRTGQDIKPEIILQIKDHKYFVGVKECVGHERIKELSDHGVKCWSGNDDQMHLSRHKYGAQGVISVTSNIVPGLVCKLMREQDDELDAKLQPLYNWLFIEPNPIGVNTLLMQLGTVKPVFRLPYTFASRDLREKILPIINSIGLAHCPCPGGSIEVLEDTDFIHKMDGDTH